ncbi:MAG: helix-hairpin-helix domain-containing protein [Chitinophagaceae bacterium]|nr:helix-hairpin-helix domain-containing protein [Chitinophagaceae bacterium]
MKWKEVVTDYFSFTRRERIGLLTLVCLIIVVFALPRIVARMQPQRIVAADTAWISAMRRMQIKEDNQKTDGGRNRGNDDFATDDSRGRPDGPQRVELTYFDPNTTELEQWQRLGINVKTAQTIRKYVEKGGKFRKPEDLKRIYSLPPTEYERIRPYVKIESGAEAFEQRKTSQYADGFTRSFPSPVDINVGDTAAFIALPGIGGKLAGRIVSFREKLGGFHSIDQLKEIYGLADSVFKKIAPLLLLNQYAVRQLNINTVTLEELKAHPYCKASLGNPIIAYRDAHGPFSTLEDLKKVMVITDEVFLKLKPYLRL